MASAPSRQRTPYHQDYIARIRYSNALPPPPLPPKLLNIPNTGLLSGQYTTAGFTSRLAREQPLNIEADAELGMPLNLVGMPGIFDGDESSIQPQAKAGPLHPADRALLRPLATLGKPTAAGPGVSFLRRTEYISSEQSRSTFSSTKGLGPSSRNRVRKQPQIDRNDPISILRGIAKGFDLAYPKDAYVGQDSESNLRAAPIEPYERKNWEEPRHPKNSSLKLLDAYPLLPDLDAFPDSGGYMTMKFNTNPQPSSSRYDPRLDVALLRPCELRPELEAEYSAAMAEYNEDPQNKPHPGPPPYDYDYFLPEHPEAVANIKRAMDVDDPDKDDPSLYAYQHSNRNESPAPTAFRFERVRTYETAKGEGSHSQHYAEVILTLRDGSTNDQTSKDGRARRKQKAAMYYPILQKNVIRARRTGNIARLGMLGAQRQEENAREEGESRIELMDLTAREPEPDEVERREGHRALCDVVLED